MRKAAASLEPGPLELGMSDETVETGCNRETQRIEALLEAERVLQSSDAFVLITRHGEHFGRIAMYDGELLLYGTEAMAQMRSEFCGLVEDEPSGRNDPEAGEEVG